MINTTRSQVTPVDLMLTKTETPVQPRRTPKTLTGDKTTHRLIRRTRMQASVQPAIRKNHARRTRMQSFLWKSCRLKTQNKSKAHQNLQAQSQRPCEPTHQRNRQFTPWFERNQRKTEQERGFLKM